MNRTGGVVLYLPFPLSQLILSCVWPLRAMESKWPLVVQMARWDALWKGGGGGGGHDAKHWLCASMFDCHTY